MKKAILTFTILAAFASAATAQDITGYWKDGSVGSIGYQNQVTGVTRSGRSHVFTYHFLANGTYEFVGYMEMNMYNCTNTLFNQINGKYTVDDSTIFLSPSRDFWRSTNSCSPSANKETTKAPVKKTLGFERRENEFGQQLLCLVDGETETCYRKEQK